MFFFQIELGFSFFLGGEGGGWFCFPFGSFQENIPVSSS